MEINAENFKTYTVIFLYSSMVEMRQLSRYSDGVWAGQPGFDSQQRQEIFSTLQRPDHGSGPTHPPIKWVLGAISMQ
jgi:hypothetical protein